MSNAQSTDAVPAVLPRHRMQIAMEDRGLNVQDMARALDCHESTIRNYLAGRTRPTRPAKIAWAFRCRVPYEWLENGEDPGPNGPGSPVEYAPRDSNPEPADSVTAQVISLARAA